MSPNYRIGVLTEWAPSAYSRIFRTELEACAADNGVTLSFMAVNWATKSPQEDPEAIEQSLQSAKELDAVIFLAGVFSHGVQGLSRFAQRWAPKPAISIGYRLPGVPSVVLDNRAGIREATTHLIETHGRRKLLFLRGRQDSKEAEERYLGFRHALRDARILFDDKRILNGDFTRTGALRAMSELEDGLEIDGIVASNDDMALAVMADLKRRRLRVPEDVSVIGFDNISEAVSAPIPLASVAQPFPELARRAVALVLEQAAGTPPPAVTSVQVALRPRRSCGC